MSDGSEAEGTMRLSLRLKLQDGREQAGADAQTVPHHKDSAHTQDLGLQASVQPSSEVNTHLAHRGIIMASAGKPSENIRRLRRKLTEILQCDTDAVLDELDCQLLITQEEYFSLSQIPKPEKKVREILNTILQRGEDACQAFLDSLENLQTTFPDLVALFEASCAGTVSDEKANESQKERSKEDCQGSEATGKVQRSLVEIKKEECNETVVIGKVQANLTEIKNEKCNESADQGNVQKSADEIKAEHCDGSEAIGKVQRSLAEIKKEEFSEPVAIGKVEKSLAEIENDKCNESADQGNVQKSADEIKAGHCDGSKTEEQVCTGEKEIADEDLYGPVAIGTVQENIEEIKKEECNGPVTDGKEDIVEKKKLGDDTDERRKAFEEILSVMKMDAYRTTNLSISDVLEIGKECLNDTGVKTLEDVPWHLLRNIMALNVSARNTSFENSTINEESVHGQNDEPSVNDNIFCLNRNYTRQTINPLDVLCVLFYCSDSFLRQEIMLKMSMCQFALPLLLPSCDTKCTFLLWAMRDIVRKWRPHSLKDRKGFREESLVLTPMPTVSFVRLGKVSLSKSKVLNDVLSPPQQHHDFFVHRDMESGNVPRRIADGLVEISWYFPGGRESSDLFPEPVAVTNLRGDIESHWLQFSFLAEVSSAVFIFLERLSEREFTLLLSLKESKTKCYFILNPQTDELDQTVRFLNKLAQEMNLDKSRLLVKGSTMNNSDFVKQLQSAMLGTTLDPLCCATIESMASTARELGVQVDDDCEQCQSARVYAKEITTAIDDIVEYKKETLKLQGDLWKRLSKVEKESCRMRRQGDTPPEAYKSQLRKERTRLRKQQNKCDLTDGMIKFINGIGQLSREEKRYFLKWMKFHLDHISRNNLSKLRAEYKELFNAVDDDPSQLAELDKKISESSLGLEHFMRELGQFYEAESSMFKNGKLRDEQLQFTHLPDIAADLLLEGYPLELIDGDASNIPLLWITDVLTKLNTKLEGRSRMIVLTVLGVQSTGKSTLLNTMFGLQFSVSSGRCTRGAFMLLIKVKDNLKKLLGCDFILVIDTEGLKAPELSMLEDSYEHDNELATLVIGLSDITIVNIAMENATEMKDILQIVVHAFLRMEEIGQIPNCQFVHQNVSDVSAYDQNMRDRKHLLGHLNEMTKTAAKMEKQRKDITFSDIMEYDPEKHNWYIPGLWHGVPPMAPVNRGYSENVHEFKKYLFEYIRNRSTNRDSKDIVQFMEWVKSLWNAVKHENFIFSFRNSLVADAYNQLSMKYSEWEWAFRKEVHLWVTQAETIIHNQTSSELDPNIYNTLKQGAFQKLQSGEQKVLTCVQKYFDSEVQNLHLIEKYREDFIRSTKSLKNLLENYSFSKLEEVIHFQKTKYKIDTLQAKYIKVIESKVVSLLEECRKQNSELNEEQLEREFGNMWKQTLMELHLNRLERRQVSDDMHCHLMKDLSSLGSSANRLLQNVQSLVNYGEIDFSVKPEYFDLPRFKGFKEFFTHEYSLKANEISNALTERCITFVEGKANSKVDYDGTFCRELLHMINDCLHKGELENLHTTPHFEVHLKLHILSRAAPVFQKMHDNFVSANDPQCRLEKLKPQYFSTFKDLYLKKDMCQKRAKAFCDQCLKPALNDYIERRLGLEVVEDIMLHGQSIKFSSRTFFQHDVLKKLLEKKMFNGFKEYIRNYDSFVKEFILEHILNHYKQTERLSVLEKNILSKITKKVGELLQTMRIKKYQTVPQFLDVFCSTLKKELVISKGSLEVIIFQNNSSVEQFSEDIQLFLPELEHDILRERNEYDIGERLSHLPHKPQDELFIKVFGCGKQCPFCKAPCEAGGQEHKEHFASVHRPQGLGGVKCFNTNALVFSLCSSDVVSNQLFRNLITKFQWHPYKDYRAYFPDWCIQPDPSIEASDYWKFIFQQLNKQFAELYVAHPAKLPIGWKKITSKQALKSLEEVFNMKEK